MTFYTGIGKNRSEYQFDTTEVKLWNVTVNDDDEYIYRGTLQAVMGKVATSFYYEDWHVEERRLLARSSQIVDLS